MPRAYPASLQILYINPATPTMTDLNSTQWLQLNIGLARANGGAIASARILFDTIAPLVQLWRENGWLDCCFFMRKPPDVRWRFLSDRPIEIQSALHSEMKILERRGIISEFFFSDYQAETRRFGGIEAMNVVHDYFDLDTHNWRALDRLAIQNRRSIDPDLLLPSLIQDLFDRVLGDDRSTLKTWHYLAALTPLSASVKTLPEIELLSLDRLSELEGLSPAELDILNSYVRAHHKLGDEFSQLWQADLLLADLYEILATIALFSFNRHGFSGERSAPLVAAVLQDLSL